MCCRDQALGRQDAVLLQLARAQQFAVVVHAHPARFGRHGDVFLAQGDALAMQLLSATAGVVLMGLLATWLEFNKRLDKSLQERRALPVPSLNS